MKKRIIQLAALTLTACLGSAQAATITVTTDAATGPGSLTAALLALNDGDPVLTTRTPVVEEEPTPA